MNSSAATSIERQKLLAALKAGGAVTETLLRDLRKALAGRLDHQMLSALQQCTVCNLGDSAERAARVATLSLAIVEMQPDLVWAYQQGGLALLIAEQFPQSEQLLLKGMARWPTHPELTFLAALVHFSTGRLADAALLLDKIANSDSFPTDRLREAAQAVRCFCLPLKPGTVLERESLQRWLRLFSTENPLDRHMGACCEHLRGRLLASAGQFGAAMPWLIRAAEQSSRLWMVYYAAQAMQAVGRWAEAQRLLDSRPNGTAELQSLRLMQTLRSRPELSWAEAIDTLPGRLTPTARQFCRAVFALHRGRPMPLQPLEAWASRSVSDQWLRLQLASTLASRQVQRAEPLMATTDFDVLPAAEKLLYRGVISWLQGDITVARRRLMSALRELPNNTTALTCLAAIEADAQELAPAAAKWKKLLEIQPNNLRPALRWMQMTDSNPRIGELASIASMIARISPAPSRFVDPRRFYCLKRVAQVDFATAQPEIAKLLAPDDFSTKRALAILYWESASDEETDNELNQRARSCYTAAGRIWRDILPRAAFWAHFATEHQVAAEHLAETRQRALDEILGQHLDRAKQYFLASDWDSSRFHLDQLTAWENIAPDGQATADEGSDRQGTEVGSKVRTMLNAWISDFLRRAEDRLSAGLESLPAGISRNFESALETIRPPLQVLPDNSRLLSFVISHLHDYIFELAMAEQFERARGLAREACQFAIRLAEKHLQPGDYLNPENQAVCRTLRLGGQLADDPGESLSLLEKLRVWGKASSNLGDSGREASYQFQLGKLAANGGNFPDAERYLKRAIQIDPTNDVFREQLAYVYTVWATALINRATARLTNLASSPSSFLAQARTGGKSLMQQPQSFHRQAMEKVRLALEVAPARLKPEIEVQTKQLPTCDDLYWQSLHTLACQLLNDGASKHFGDLAAALEVDSHTPRFEDNRLLLANVYGALLDLAWDRNDLERVLQFAQRAHECDPTNPVLKNNLDLFRNARTQGGLESLTRGKRD